MTGYRRDAADTLHGSTKHGTAPTHPDRLVTYPRLDPTNQPAPFKEYPRLPVVPLPRRLVPSHRPAVAALSGGTAEPVPLDASVLSTLLHLAAGVTRVAGGARGRIFFRAAMSAGNLHPVEVYVIAGEDVDGVPAGVHHYAPLPHGLTALRPGDQRGALGVRSAAALVLTGLVWRTTWKYGERGWRHLYWDAGTMLANLLAAAAAHGLAARVRVAFPDEAAARLVGIDGVDELPLAVVTLGDDGNAVPDPIDAPPLTVDVAPVAPRPVRLPLLVEAQAEGSLAAGEAADWAAASAGVVASAATRVDPPSGAPEEPIEAVILRRGSTRVMRPDPIDAERLRWPMAATTRAVPLDAAAEGTLLEHYVNVHAVDGAAAGPHRWTGIDVEPVGRVAHPRRAAEALCLGQPLGGDSAYTAFHHADLDSILDALGSRGYRAAQLEAGIASGRLALAAFAVGLGATGLTFLDDPVSGYFGTETAPMLVTAVGPSATPPAGGGPPGRPVHLRRWGRLMGRP